MNAGHRLDQHLIDKCVNVKAGQSGQAAVGSYLNSQPKPTFKITVKPELGDQLAYNLEKMDIPGTAKYILFYHLQNFSNQDCQVTITNE